LHEKPEKQNQRKEKQLEGGRDICKPGQNIMGQWLAMLF